MELVKKEYIRIIIIIILLFIYTIINRNNIFGQIIIFLNGIIFGVTLYLYLKSKIK
jgi:energy-coupling factor transporter transmembrane protein EcfT